MIFGYGMHGHITDSLVFFHQMHQKIINPNHITFVVVLSACITSFVLDPKNDGCCMLLPNIYAGSRRWDSAKG